MAGGRRSVPGAAAADPERIERGRRLFAQDCRFVTGAATPAGIPEGDVPEVAFAGRSNVGKSSLLNALTTRHGLAKVSRTPGRTRQINFFALTDKLMLVDLPGYGYAQAGKSEIAAWNRLLANYLKGRARLRRVCLLIDARLGPADPDRLLMNKLDRLGVSYQVVLTKSDKVTGAALDLLLVRLAEELGGFAAAHPEVIVTSARERRGLSELRAALAELAN